MASRDGIRLIHKRPMRTSFGFLLRPLVERFFGRMRFSPAQEARLQDLARKGRIVYVMYASSVLHYLFINFWCLKLQLPLAAYGNGIPGFVFFQPFRKMVRTIYMKIRALMGSQAHDTSEPITGLFEEAFDDRRAIVLFLRHNRVFKKRTFTEPGEIINTLMGYQKKSREPVFLVPMEILWGKQPVKVQRSLLDIMLGDKEAPGFIRQVLMLLRYSRHSIATMGRVMNLKAFQRENAHVEEELLCKKIRWALHREMTLAEQQITGPRLKPRKYVLRSILSNMRLREVARDIARAEGTSFDRVMKRAERYADEIAADYNNSYIAFLDVVLTWVWNNIYNGLSIDKAGIEALKKASGKGSLILLPTHKSHVDYLLLSYAFYYNDLPPPHIAAGVNLSFFPLGRIFRKAGAFFIRRTFRGKKLYATVFRTYVRWLMREGYPQEFFLEGTRSRTGKLMYPKLGMLSMELDAFSEGVSHDVYLCPISICYEKVVEESSYTRESGGAKKKGESIGALLRMPKFLKKKYGRVYVQFGQPMSMREYLQNRQADIAAMDSGGRMRIAEDLALRVCHSINEVTTVTPSSLTAMVLLNHTKRGITRADLQARASFLFGILSDLGARSSVSLHNLPWSVDEALQVFAADKAIRRWEDPQGAIYAIDEAQRTPVNFYKNNIIHYFVPLALGAAIFRMYRTNKGLSENRVLEGIDFFRRLFRREFIFPPDDPTGTCYKIFKDVFVEKRKYVVLNESGEYEVQKRQPLHYVGRLLTNYFEAYYLVCCAAEELLEKRTEEREFLKKAIETADRLYRRGDVLHPESKSVFVFRNALPVLVSMGFINRKQKKSAAYLTLEDKGKEDLASLRSTLSGLFPHRHLQPGEVDPEHPV